VRVGSHGRVKSSEIIFGAGQPGLLGAAANAASSEPSSKAQQMSDYLLTVRAISNGVFTDSPGMATTFLKLEDADMAPFDPNKSVPPDDWVREVVGQVVKNTDATGVLRGDVLVYVHGYNNSMEEVLKRHRILKRDLPSHGFAGTIITFDWPCYDSALAYVPDREKAKVTAFRLVRDCIWRVARMQGQLDCDINVHLLAHSTGAYVVQEAFDDADDRNAINAINWTVSQIALISGDVSSDSMAEGDADTESIYRHCVRLTNYSNGHDEVLQISNIKRVGIEPRAGRVGLPATAPPSAVNVDCGQYYAASVAPQATGVAGITTSHSWQFGNPVFTEDLAQTLNGNVDRSVITTREVHTANRFVLKIPNSS
jgi:esterase/lipase superfamily enzyme